MFELCKITLVVCSYVIHAAYCSRCLRSIKKVYLPPRQPGAKMVVLVASLCHYYNNNTHLTSVFQDNLGKLVPNVSILDFIGAKDDGGGGDNWSCKTCKAPVK